MTGAAQGIGAAVARRLAAEGSDLALADRNVAGAEATAMAYRELGVRVIVVATDVSKQADIKHLLERTVAELGPVNQLVNAAAIGDIATLDQVTEEEWDRTLAVDLKGTFFACQAVGLYMSERKEGRIVNFASINAKVTYGTTISYSAAKAGVVNLTQSLAKALGPSGINVNAVCPGWVWTAMMEKASKWRAQNAPGIPSTGVSAYEEYVERIKLQTALGIPTNPDDVANAVVFLLSDEARNMTGQSLNVDSGVVFH